MQYASKLFEFPFSLPELIAQCNLGRNHSQSRLLSHDLFVIEILQPSMNLLAPTGGKDCITQCVTYSIMHLVPKILETGTDSLP